MEMPKQEFAQMSEKDLLAIRPGDIIERMLAFCIPQYIGVGKVTDDVIEAGLWEFDRKTGVEIDKDIPVKVSYIRRRVTKEMKKYLDESGKSSIPYPFEQT